MSTDSPATVVLTVYAVSTTIIILILVCIVVVIGLWHSRAFRTRVELTLQKYTVGRVNSRAQDYTANPTVHGELAMEENEAYTVAANPYKDTMEQIYASIDAPNEDLVMKEIENCKGIGCAQIDEGDYEFI